MMKNEHIIQYKNAQIVQEER